MPRKAAQSRESGKKISGVSRVPALRPPFGGTFRDKRVLVTGHTGFKGAWLSLWLHRLGAEVHGYALRPPTRPSLYDEAAVATLLTSEEVADVRDLARVKACVARVRPHVVFHLAAQPLVLAGYDDPVGTAATNVLGTVHVLEALRGQKQLRAVQVVTTDKCYDNNGKQRAFRETDALGGKDPYSASKAAAEIMARMYRESFFAKTDASLATARGGNVVGGGDWADNRLVPDLVRAYQAGRAPVLRNPDATRPWQYVLDLLSGYLWLAARQLEAPARFASAWNFGPATRQSATVGEIAAAARKSWGPVAKAPTVVPLAGKSEAATLALDSAKARRELGWSALLDGAAAVRTAVEWYHSRSVAGPAAVPSLCERAIAQHELLARQAGMAWA